MLASFLSGEFVIPCRAGFFCFVFLNLGSFFYTSHADFVFMWGVSLTHPVLPSFFFFFAGSFSYTSRAVLFFMQGVSLTHPMHAFFFFFFLFFFFI